MTRTAGLAARLRAGRRDSSARRGALTAGGVLAAVARLVLWLVLAVLLIRGLADMLGEERSAPAPSPGRGC